MTRLKQLNQGEFGIRGLVLKTGSLILCEDIKQSRYCDLNPHIVFMDLYELCVISTFKKLITRPTESLIYVNDNLVC